MPPYDILSEEHVPAAPPVQNMTDGAVSDETAQLWANASNRGSGWYEWAEANDQPEFLLHLLGPAVVGTPQEQTVLSSGGHILQPACNLYPARNSLFKIELQGEHFFAARGLHLTDSYVLVIQTTPGPCSETLVQADGTQQTVLDYSGTTIAFEPGTYRTDPLLGSLWYTDGGGNCQDAGAPAEWCGR
ncbi:MAG: hypothetical protein JOY68_09885 [Candidatus Dormibacteraeota bacterium]|nr:hypothetical protein [Candidatus Dormibacteraeota bacterium]